MLDVPGCPVIVLRDRIGHVQIRHRFHQVVQVAFVGELLEIIADDDQALVLVFIVPVSHGQDDMLAVDAIEGPHIEQDHLTTQFNQPQRWSIFSQQVYRVIGHQQQVNDQLCKLLADDDS